MKIVSLAVDRPTVTWFASALIPIGGYATLHRVHRPSRRAGCAPGRGLFMMAGRLAPDGPVGRVLLPLDRWAPGLAALLHYDRQDLGSDVRAGLAVAAVAVPVGIAYAGLAGFGPETGLYASLFPLLAYAIFGSSRQLIVGPDAATCAVVAAAIAPLAGADPVRYAALAGMLTLIAGLFCIAASLLRLGALADFLSQAHPRRPAQRDRNHHHARPGRQAARLHGHQPRLHTAPGRGRRPDRRDAPADPGRGPRRAGVGRPVAAACTGAAGRHRRDGRLSPGRRPVATRFCRRRHARHRAGRPAIAQLPCGRLGRHARPACRCRRPCARQFHQPDLLGAQLRLQERLRDRRRPGTDSTRRVQHRDSPSPMALPSAVPTCAPPWPTPPVDAPTWPGSSPPPPSPWSCCS